MSQIFENKHTNQKKKKIRFQYSLKLKSRSKCVFQRDYIQRYLPRGGNRHRRALRRRTAHTSTRSMASLQKKKKRNDVVKLAWILKWPACGEREQSGLKQMFKFLIIKLGGQRTYETNDASEPPRKTRQWRVTHRVCLSRLIFTRERRCVALLRRKDETNGC